METQTNQTANSSNEILMFKDFLNYSISTLKKHENINILTNKSDDEQDKLDFLKEKNKQSLNREIYKALSERKFALYHSGLSYAFKSLISFGDNVDWVNVIIDYINAEKIHFCEELLDVINSPIDDIERKKLIEREVRVKTIADYMLDEYGNEPVAKKDIEEVEEVEEVGEVEEPTENTEEKEQQEIENAIEREIEKEEEVEDEIEETEQEQEIEKQEGKISIDELDEEGIDENVEETEDMVCYAEVKSDIIIDRITENTALLIEKSEAKKIIKELKKYEWENLSKNAKDLDYVYEDNDLDRFFKYFGIGVISADTNYLYIKPFDLSKSSENQTLQDAKHYARKIIDNLLEGRVKKVCLKDVMFIG